jgi:hypothetical protein
VTDGGGGGGGGGDDDDDDEKRRALEHLNLHEYRCGNLEYRFELEGSFSGRKCSRKAVVTDSAIRENSKMPTRIFSYPAFLFAWKMYIHRYIIF